jgi:hypothetical protein
MPAVRLSVAPKVVPLGTAVLELRLPPDLVPTAAEGRLLADLYPAEQFGAGRRGIAVAARAGSGVVHLTLDSEEEQEHVVVLRREGSDQQVAEARVYSVRDDLFVRRPFKGDFHIHSCRSDGKEPPAEVAAWCRHIGLDFAAVTDHGLYAPSLEARDAFARLPVDIRIFPGEEVHPPGNPAHMVNFGGAGSICALYEDDAAYRRGVSQVADRLPAAPEGIDSFQYASCVWCFDRIREAGGLGIFCHPYWFYQHQYTPPGALTSHVLAERPFDAFELIGGFHRSEADSNTLQVARYHEEQRRCGPMPVVGCSDAHGCNTGELFGWYYTIAFAPSCELPDLIGAVRDLYSVAVEALPGGIPRAYGPFRLVKFALFLMREVLPGHDAVCREEGELMLAHLRGEGGAAGRLGDLSGRAAALVDGLWGGTAVSTSRP